MPKNTQKGSNFKYGINIDINGDGGLTDEKFIPGHRVVVQLHDFAAADIGKVFFIAPYPCKVVRAYERHLTVAGQAGTLTVEKVPSGTAPGSGSAAMAAAADLTAAINTNQTIAALTTAAATLAAGDALATKVASGAATSLAGASMAVVLEWV